MEQTADQLKTEYSKLTKEARDLIYQLRTQTTTQTEVGEKHATLQYLNDTYDYLTNQSNQILTKKSYLVKTPEAYLIKAQRRARTDISDAKWYLNNIDIKKIKQQQEKEKQQNDELEKLLIVGAYFYYGYSLFKITKVTPSMVKYKECDSTKIETKDLGGNYYESKKMVKCDDLQEFDKKKERGITKSKLHTNNFYDEKGSKYEFGKPWCYTMDMGN
jgi:hypothetical protein